jgi:hypothetical protein
VPGIQSLLEECTVRVVVGGQSSGTGFFVAPGMVVTCAHVVEAVTLSSDAVAPAVEVVDAQQARHAATLDPRDVWPEDAVDLAILRIDATVEHASVLLDVDCRERDSVSSFGFPKKYPEGVPTQLTVEGEMGAPTRWLKLANGQVQPGMSGAGVVNVRTGGVCGVLKRTRDQQTDLGGYAVPITTLFRQAPRLERDNERVHVSDSRWIDLLPSEVRRLRRASQRARPAEAVPDRRFVITVGQAEDGWKVSADLHPDGELVGPVPIDLNTVRRQVARLFRDWASRGRVQHEGGEIALLGSILFRAVLPGAIGERFAELRAEGSRLAVALRFEQGTDCDLIQLPWEHLYYEDESGRGICLARDGSATFARAIQREPAESEVPHRRSLRVLVVAVRPQWEADGDAAVKQVDEVVAALEATGNRVGALDVVRMDEDAPDAFAVRNALADFHVVHYVGFGRFAGAADELALGGDGDFGIDYVEPGELAEALADGAPELLVLQLLKGRENELPADFSVLAPNVMEQAERIPAVIASQYPIQVRAATKFNDTLYEHLARGTTVDVAVQEARSKLAWGRPSVSPALFVRAPGDLRLTAPGSDVVQPRSGAADAAYG